MTFQEMIENKLFIEKYSSLFNKDSYYKLFNENTKIFFIDNEYNVNEYYIEKSALGSYIDFSLWTILQLPLGYIIPSNINVFFFMTNAYQSHIPNCKEQNDIIRKEYKLYFKNNISMLITYICVFWIGNIVSYFILKWIFNKVIIKKESYVEIFFNIEGKLIFDCLNKCEKFLNYIISKDNSNLKNNNFSESDSSSFFEKSSSNESFFENNYNNKNEKNESSYFSKKKNSKKSKNIEVKILWIIIYILMTGILTFDTYFQFKVYNNYNTISNLVNIQLNIELNTLEMGSYLRAFIFNQTTHFNGIPTEEFFSNRLNNFYDENKNYYSNLTKELKNFPLLRKKYNNLYYSNLCNYTTYFFVLINYNGSCENFTSNTISHGVDQAVTFYMEIIRYLYSLYRSIEGLRKKFNFVYNLTYLGTNLENIYVPQNKELERLYFIGHPMFIFNDKFNSILNFIYNVVLFPVYEDLFNILRSALYSRKYLMKLYIIPLMCSGIFTLSLFLFGWKRYELNLNETIFKTKKMLSIIPIETLMKVKNIKNILEIDDENNESKKIKWNPVIGKLKIKTDVNKNN